MLEPLGVDDVDVGIGHRRSCFEEGDHQEEGQDWGSYGGKMSLEGNRGGSHSDRWRGKSNCLNCPEDPSWQHCGLRSHWRLEQELNGDQDRNYTDPEIGQENTGLGQKSGSLAWDEGVGANQETRRLAGENIRTRTGSYFTKELSKIPRESIQPIFEFFLNPLKIPLTSSNQIL